MDDGNFLISYSQPAFTIVFKSEIEDNGSYINEYHIDEVCRAEVLINCKGEQNIFDKVGKICLFGRSKMFMDGENSVVIKIFEFKSLVNAGVKLT